MVGEVWRIGAVKITRIVEIEATGGMSRIIPDATRDNYPPADCFTGVDWPYPVMADDAAGSIMTMFGMSRVPSWVVIDDQNFVTVRVTGALDEAGLEALVGLAAG